MVGRSSKSFELRLHRGFQGEKLGLVAALAFFSERLEDLALALIGLLTEGMALLQDPTSSLSCSWRLSWRRWSQRRRTSRKAELPPTAATAAITRSASSLMREARVIFRR